MNPVFAKEVMDKLCKLYHFKRSHQGWRQYGLCPQCHKRELYVHEDSPWVVRCGREAKCGWEGHTKDMFPEIFEGFNKRFKATDADPCVTAKAYLSIARGLDLKQIHGWYEQGNYWHPDADKGTATVRFYLDQKRTVYMERLIEEVTLTDPATGEKSRRKAHFKGPHQGLSWRPPTLTIKDHDEIWLVEGCLDAMALHQNGIQAVAILSCGNYPTALLEQHQSKHVTWVWALDNDQAGRKYTRKHVDRMREEGYTVAAAQVPGKGKQDWNDLHQAKRLTSTHMDTYRYHGALLIAQSASEKAQLIYHRRERREFHFDYNQRTYWFALNMDRYDKAIQSLAEDDAFSEQQKRARALKESGAISELANCAFHFLYYQRHHLTDEAWYYARISFPHQGAPVKDTFTSNQLGGAAQFGDRLLHTAAGAVWDGSTKQLAAIKKDQLFNIKTVQAVDFVGYSKAHKCYVYGNVAVKEGLLYRLNDEDFFDMGHIAIKTLEPVTLSINQNREQYNQHWLPLLQACGGTLGTIALAYWVGALIAEQIRALHKSYPFLEIVGEPGAGKTTMVEFLWKLVGRVDYEGFDPGKASASARSRNLSQVSNLPVVFIEADRAEHALAGKGFDWDETKPFYNGRSVSSRGIKNNSNDTKEPPFRAALVISQNAEVNASQAVLERIVHTKFTRAEHTQETKAMAEQLERMPIEQVSYFLLDCITHEGDILKIVKDKTPHYEQYLIANPDIKTVRIAKNHAQIMALVDALQVILPLSDEDVTSTHARLTSMAIERQQAISADHPLVQEFWEAYDYLNGADDAPKLNHSKNPQITAINLNHFLKVANDERQQIPPLTELKRHLKNSKSRKYLGQRPVSSNIFNSDYGSASTVKCWVFERPA